MLSSCGSGGKVSLAKVFEVEFSSEFGRESPIGLDGLGSRYETPWALTGVATTERQSPERASARRV